MVLQRKSIERPGRLSGIGEDKLIAAVAEAIAVAQADCRKAEDFSYMNLKTVCRLTTLSRGQIYRLVDAGKFPVPVSLSEKRRAWVQSDVLAWMEDKARGRFGGPS